MATRDEEGQPAYGRLAQGCCPQRRAAPLVRARPAKWDEFRRRYAAELDHTPAAWQPMLEAAQRGDVTLLYSSHDTEHNNAVALKAYLEQQLKETNHG